SDSTCRARSASMAGGEPSAGNRRKSFIKREFIDTLHREGMRAGSYSDDRVESPSYSPLLARILFSLLSLVSFYFAERADCRDYFLGEALHRGHHFTMWD